MTNIPNMPDITKVQILAVVQWIAGFAAAFGLELSEEAQDAIVQVCTAGLIVLPLADAWLRSRRATAFAAVVNHNTTVAMAGPDRGHELSDDAGAAPVAVVDVSPPEA